MTPWTERVAMGGETSRRVEEQMREKVSHTAAGGQAAIDQRLAELADEWDIERALVSWAPIPISVGLALGAFVHRRWLVVPAVITGFLAAHAVLGWSPPVFLLRRLGVRTRDEINQERYALKALRGDFHAAEGVDTALADVMQ